MQIIGAGFGRTGTMSLKAALEQIGFGPCYHMLEVLKHPSHIGGWLAAAEGEQVDWDGLLGNYQAGLDYPLSVFYKELLAVYPEAKVILTVRDPQRWYESTLETIYQGAALPDWVLRILPPYRDFIKMVRMAVWEGLFEGRFEERAYAIKVFEDWVIEVKRTVPAEKLLIFSVKDGWEPLCAFLGVPVPDKPFPHINDRKMTQRMFAAAKVGAILMAGLTFVIIVWLLGSII
ncbi:MAG: sulfotransferase family protein [Chloroflexi bacterium]|nr:sulfotransferase family protein [Chloroflexota bacterium]